MWGSVPAEESCGQNSARENTRNAFCITEDDPGFPTNLKYLVPKLLMFTAIFLLICSIMMFAVRISSDKNERSNTSFPVVAALVNEAQNESLANEDDYVHEDNNDYEDEDYNECSYQQSNSDNQTNRERLQKDVFSRVREQWNIPPKCKQGKPRLILVLRSIPEIPGSKINVDDIDCGEYTKEFCLFTSNRSEITIADAVIFQGFKSNEDDILVGNSNSKPSTHAVPPSNSDSSQIWIFKVMRPFMPYWYNYYRNYSNCLSASYDFQSDIPYLRENYYEEGNSSQPTKKTDQSEVKVAVYNLDCKEEEMFFKKHGGAINSLVKNGVIVDFYRFSDPSQKCNVTNNYNVQPKSNCSGLHIQKCYDKISPGYKFALAFEISDSDYISERFFAPLRSGMIPIVMYNSKRENYDALAPKHSYIPFNQDFDTLQKLNSDEKELKKYFEWRNKGRIGTADDSGWFCQACGHVFKTQYRRQ